MQGPMANHNPSRLNVPKCSFRANLFGSSRRLRRSTFFSFVIFASSSPHSLATGRADRHRDTQTRTPPRLRDRKFKMEDHNSTLGPLLDIASNGGQQIHTTGATSYVASTLAGLSAWSIIATVLAILVVYDQGTTDPVSMHEDQGV
jgi:hypothetical protein